MKMKEVTEQTGLTERTVRYYMEKGLIAPHGQWRNGREYTEFDETDIARLKAVATLRELGFSVEAIRSMQAEPGLIPQIVAERRQAAESESKIANETERILSGINADDADSIEELVNSVVLVDKDGDAGRVLGRASNAASIAKYGLLQQVESLSGDENTAQARQRVKNLLQQQDKITKERTVEDLWGDDAAVSGALVQFVPNRYDVSGPMRITGVTHRYGAEHLMSVTVRTDKQPRAAGSADTVTV